MECPTVKREEERRKEELPNSETGNRREYGHKPGTESTLAQGRAELTNSETGINPKQELPTNSETGLNPALNPLQKAPVHKDENYPPTVKRE